MNRSFESRGANGIDREGESRDWRESREAREMREAREATSNREREEWGHRSPEVERSGQERYGYPRRQDAPYGGFIGDHDRFARDDRDRDRDRELERDRHRMAERPRYWQELQDPGEHYWQRSHDLPPPSQLPPREVWRGRNEDYDFWGRERHPHERYGHGSHHEEHPSFWARVKGAFTGKGPKNYVRSDERIREDVCEHLSYHPYVDASDIEVVVRDGEVTLSGTVDGRMVKRAAEECCDHVRGVKDVHNHLRVRPRGEPAAP